MALPLFLQYSEASVKTTVFCLVGSCKYADNFTHFDYANPEAPKGGILREVRSGSFDTLNIFAGKGVLPDYIFQMHAPLMVRSLDEPYSVYPMIAEAVEYPEDYSWIIFHLNPAARFSDGSPVTADDVRFSLNAYQTSGSPYMKALYKDVGEPEILDRHRILFPITKPNRKVISTLSYLRIFSKQYWSTREFSGKHLFSFVTSGPYRVKSVKPGHSIVYERIVGYWAENLPVNKGRYNFDQIRVDYVLDRHSAFEGFKTGQFDVYIDPDIQHWHQNYNFPAVHQGNIIRETESFTYPTGMMGLVFNLRKPFLQNMALRKALAAAINFQWINEKLLFSDYQRFTSFFTGTELSARGLPDQQELELLLPFKSELPPEVLTQPVSVPLNSSEGNNRADRIRVIQLLQDAGYELQEGVMVNAQTGIPLTLKLITSNPRQERLLLPFSKSLARVGVTLKITTLDQSQFRARVRSFDFDLVDWYFFQSVYPGPELYNSWGSSTAMEKRSGNVAGVQNPAIDFLLEKLFSVKQYEELIPVCRALDRIIMHSHYIIPKWYSTNAHFAYWKHLKHPSMKNIFWLDLNNWWYQP